MKCISCEMEINPKWKHAIELNACPFCGQIIVDEQLRTLLSSLRETMDQLSAYPEQLNDWMLSNHNYIKTNSENLVTYVPKDLLKDYAKDSEKDFLERKNKKFTVKVTTETGEQEVIAEKIQSDEKTTEFHKRAEAVKPNLDGFSSVSEKTQHLKALAQQIRREGATVMNQAGNAATIMPAEMNEVADPEMVAELSSLISDGDIISSALPEPDLGGDEIPSVVLRMANAAKGGAKDPNDDLIKLKQLQAKAQRNSLSGRGGFSRS